MSPPCGRGAAAACVAPAPSLAVTALRARGGVWPKADREAGVVPHSAIDPAAPWTKSGWPGWVDGGKRPLVGTVAGVWIPLKAALTPATVADNAPARTLLADLPAAVRLVVGDSHYCDATLGAQVAADGRPLVAPTGRGYPHGDDGAAVRRRFHHLRSHAIEHGNGQVTAIFDVNGPVPTRGRVATARFALGAVLVAQLTLLHRHEAGLDLRVGLNPFLQAA
jgi:hypothetical protein